MTASLEKQLAVAQKELDIANQKVSDLNKLIRDKKWEQSKARSKSYEKRKKMLNDAVPILKDILKPNMFVKVTGSRAGSYRKIVDIRGGNIFGATCSTKRDGTITRVDNMNIIECGINKITSVLVDGEWIPTRKIVEGYNG